ncbi:hypothetical protein F2P81_014141 [Scophthalmus maximus]|uniref:Glycerol-3-phosphate acyltransferase 2, mitochondrial n=1 Tax=Scophthalmus maximus TaxID=52904 RepID=A0A6A4SNE2_SCOMX|nr:hypothetical protein F2P81_014141 [Scophthalmus maximus]
MMRQLNRWEHTLIELLRRVYLISDYDGASRQQTTSSDKLCRCLRISIVPIAGPVNKPALTCEFAQETRYKESFLKTGNVDFFKNKLKMNDETNESLMKLKFTTASLRYLLLFDEKLIRVLASHLPPHLPLASHPSWSVLKTMTDVSSDEVVMAIDDQEKADNCAFMPGQDQTSCGPVLPTVRPGQPGECGAQKRKKLGQNSFLGFRNLLSFNETQTRYRGWLVRRVCCALFVSGRKVYASPVSNRLERVCQSNRFVGWVMLKMFSSVFGGIQVNLNHLSVLRKVSQEESMLVYVYVRQSVMDCALIPLVLFGHNLRVPYTVCPLRVYSSPLRSILQKVGVFLLPPTALTEQEAEMDSLYSPVMTSLLRELLHEGQAISVGVSAESGQGGQWLARIRQLIKDGSVPDVSLVPVGISYDCVPKTNIQGVNASALCRDVAWLTEELLFRNKDVGFGGSLAEVMQYSLSLLAPHLIIAAVPSRKDPFIVPHPSLAATLHLALQAKIVTHTFVLEAVGACAVSAMLCEVVASGISSSIGSDGVDGEEVRGDVEFDVVLCQSELTEHALHLCHLLPPGFMPPCQSSQSFALDAIDSLVRCGILIMEDRLIGGFIELYPETHVFFHPIKIPREVPICDFLKREGTLTWTTSDDPDESDSDCEEPDLHAYKCSHSFHRCVCTAALQLSYTLFLILPFLLRPCLLVPDKPTKSLSRDALLPLQYAGWTPEGAVLDHDRSGPHRHTSASVVLFGLAQKVLSEERQREGVFLAVSPLFQLSENRQKLHRFITQYLYN